MLRLSTEEKETFGKRLKLLRKRADKRLTDIASKIGITRQTLSAYEKNQSKPDYETLKKLAQFYNVSTDYLVGLEEGTTHNYQYIIRETGLTEKAITLLQKFNKKAGFKFEIFAINQILQNATDNPFLILLAKYAAVPHVREKDFKDEEYKKLLPFFSRKIYIHDPYEMDNGESLFHETVHIDDFLYYQLIREFYSFLEKIKNDDESKKKWIRHLSYAMSDYILASHISINDADIDDVVDAVDAFMHEDDEEIWGTSHKN